MVNLGLGLGLGLRLGLRLGSGLGLVRWVVNFSTSAVYPSWAHFYGRYWTHQPNAYYP